MKILMWMLELSKVKVFLLKETREMDPKMKWVTVIS